MLPTNKQNKTILDYTYKGIQQTKKKEKIQKKKNNRKNGKKKIKKKVTTQTKGKQNNYFYAFIAKTLKNETNDRRCNFELKYCKLCFLKLTFLQFFCHGF